MTDCADVVKNERGDTRGPGRCDMDTVRGDRCSRPAVLEAYSERWGWERYCTRHANYYGVRGHRQTRELEPVETAAVRGKGS